MTRTPTVFSHSISMVSFKHIEYDQDGDGDGDGDGVSSECEGEGMVIVM